MTVKGLPSKGTIFAIGSGDADVVAYADETLLPVGRCTAIPGVERTRNMEDVSALEDEWAQDMPGDLKRAEAMTVDCFRIFGDAGQQMMATAWAAGTLKWYRVTYSDGTVGHGQCYVQTVGPASATVDNKLSGSFVVKPQNYAEVPAA
jgi:hypothetical protein